VYVKKGEQQPQSDKTGAPQDAGKAHKKKEFVPTVFKEASDNQDIVKFRQDLMNAYLSNQIGEIEKAVAKAAEHAHEGQLDKVIEVCKNRIEKLQLSQ
jgi:hypothetical protein